MIERPDPSHAREAFFFARIQPIVRNPLVAEAFRIVDRKRFVPAGYKYLAYTDFIVNIGEGSTMSQPTIMATMLDLLELSGKERVLEIGTASGYNAVLLSRCAAEVFTMEYNPALAQKAQAVLAEYTNVTVQVGDGAMGIPEQAPFDRIILTAAVKEFPQSLFDQLKDQGVVVAPIGEADVQQLIVGRKSGNEFQLRPVFNVRFVPLQTP